MSPKLADIAAAQGDAIDSRYHPSAAVRRQLQIAEGRMKIPQLSAGELTALQKQVVDLKAQLGELGALSSARVLDR